MGYSESKIRNSSRLKKPSKAKNTINTERDPYEEEDRSNKGHGYEPLNAAFQSLWSRMHTWHSFHLWVRRTSLWVGTHPFIWSTIVAAISIVTLLLASASSPANFPCTVPLLSSNFAVCNQDTLPPPAPSDTLLYQATIPDQRLALGEIVRHGGVIYQRGVAVKDFRSTARTLNTLVELSSLSRKDSLKESIDGLVASTDTAGNLLVRLSSRFDATMRNLPMHDTKLIQSLTKIEQQKKTQAVFDALKAIVSHLGIDPEATERVLDYVFRFTNWSRVPKRDYKEAVQDYVTAQSEALKQMMNYTIDASKPVCEMGEYLQDISDTVKKQAYQINVKDKPALEALLSGLGPDHLLAREHEYDLEVLNEVDASQREWAEYCNLLLSGLQKLENDLDIIKADLNAWFAEYRSRSSIEMAMQTLKNRLLAIIA